MRKQPLHLRLLFHPQSQVGQQIAIGLLQRFVEPPASIGLRIPTFFGPDNGDGLPPPVDGPQSVNLGVAEHTIVILLADTTMVRQVEATDTGQQWLEFAAQISAQADRSGGAHEFFSVALDAGGFSVAEERNIVRATSGTLEDRVNHI